MAHSPATQEMPFVEFLGNLVLLIVGGNDTTRNTISGSVLALNQNPDEYRKMTDDPSIITSMVPEMVCWQTSLAHMRAPLSKTRKSATSRSMRRIRS